MEPFNFFFHPSLHAQYLSKLVILVLSKEVLKKFKWKSGHLRHFLPMGRENVSNKEH